MHYEMADWVALIDDDTLIPHYLEMLIRSIHRETS